MGVSDRDWKQTMLAEGWWEGPDNRWYAPPEPFSEAAWEGQDSWGVHFIYSLLLQVVLGYAILIGVGVFWLWWIIRSTGRSAWWMLALLVPILNVAIYEVAIWRYTSQTIYFENETKVPKPPRTIFTSKWQSTSGWESLSLHGLIWRVRKRPEVVAELDRRAGITPPTGSVMPPGIGIRAMDRRNETPREE